MSLKANKNLTPVLIRGLESLGKSFKIGDNSTTTTRSEDGIAVGRCAVAASSEEAAPLLLHCSKILKLQDAKTATGQNNPKRPGTLKNDLLLLVDTP